MTRFQRLFQALALLTMFSGAAAANTDAAARRVALVIGNSAYMHTTPLPNPANDASAIAEKFESFGYEVVRGFDLGVMAMTAKLREFARLSNGAEIAVFFYAGHGIAVDGENYLVPIDAKFTDPTALDFEAVSMTTVVKQMSYTKGANLIFLDACRNNPLARSFTRSLGGLSRNVAPRGLAEMKINDAGFGTGIAFATSPGEVALDGEGMHSPFTEALLRHMGEPNKSISSIMNNVTGYVYNMTEQEQRPWFNQSFTGEVILRPMTTAPEAAPEAVASAAPASDDEKFVFMLARESGDAADYRGYLDLYPDGRFASLARSALRRMDGAETPNVENVSVAAATPATAPTPTAAPAQVTRAMDPQGPVALPMTNVLASLPSGVHTEQSLLMDKNKKRELQARLISLGYTQIGYPDGSLGPNSRTGIRAWQSSMGLIPSGYFNAAQLELLTVQSEAGYMHVLASASRPVQRHRVQRVQASTHRTTSSGDGVGDTIFGKIVGGIAEGIGQGIGRALVD